MTQVTYATIDFPGAKSTEVNGVIRRGPLGRNVETVGTYEDIAGFHGFVHSGAEFVTLDAPHAANTWALGIASDGKVVGWYARSLDGPDTGFIYDSGTYTGNVDNCPAAATSSHYWGLNATGSRVGSYYIETEGQSGFLYYNSTCFAIPWPDGPPPEQSVIELCGINASGQWVGYLQTVDGPAHGLFASLPTAHPAHVDAPGANSTVLRGINDAGIICGYADGHGFVINHGVYTMLEFPGATRTEAHGISNAASAPAGTTSFEVVGNYSLQGQQHGFIATVTSSPIPRITEAQTAAPEAAITE